MKSKVPLRLQILLASFGALKYKTWGEKRNLFWNLLRISWFPGSCLSPNRPCDQQHFCTSWPNLKDSAHQGLSGNIVSLFYNSYRYRVNPLSTFLLLRKRIHGGFEVMGGTGLIHINVTESSGVPLEPWHILIYVGYLLHFLNINLWMWFWCRTSIYNDEQCCEVARCPLPCLSWSGWVDVAQARSSITGPRPSAETPSCIISSSLLFSV